MRWPTLMVTLAATICAAGFMLAVEPEPPVPPADTAANNDVLARLTADINGDGIADRIVVDTTKKDHLDAVSGSDSSVIWTSACTMPEWGAMNQLGRVFAPVLHDINEDGLDDFIFSSRGCKAIVALDHKTGAIVWQLPWKEALGFSTPPAEIRPGLNWWERDLRLEGDRLLLAVRRPTSKFMSGIKQSEILVALDPHTGELRWKGALPLAVVPQNVAKYREGFDAVRADSEAGMTLRLRPAGSVVPYTSSPAPVSIGNTSIGFVISIELPITLQGIADTSRFLIADGRAIAASLVEVGAVWVHSGLRAWTWYFPEDISIFNPVLLSHGGRIFVAGWQNKAFRADGVFVAALDAKSGREMWRRLLDEGFPTGSGKDPVRCKMNLTAGEQFTIDYQSPLPDVPSKRVVLDAGTGKTISNSGV